MNLREDVFSIDCSKMAEDLSIFISRKVEELRREGVVVAISGGLDSSTVAALCVRALGKEGVTGLILPEKQGAPEAYGYAEQIAGHLGIGAVTFDITKVIDAIGGYDFVISRIPYEKGKEKLVQTMFNISKSNPFLKCARGTAKPIFYKGVALCNAKHRLRMVVTYKYAEENNLLVVGSAHKSENMVGLYVKFGIDNNADIMPLKNLYRSHVVQIARYVGIPDEIIHRKPSPDMMPGVEDKYYDILGIAPSKVDLILYGLENGMTCSQIAEELDFPEDKVVEIEELMSLTAHMRNPSMAP